MSTINGATSQRRLATVGVLIAIAVSAIEATVVTTAMPKITAELGDRALYGWVFSAFLVANAVSVLVCGKLADSLGRKPTFVLGSLTFVIGSLLSASASSVPWLIAFRVIQGLGAGGIQPVAMTITTDLYSLKERARIQGLYTAVFGSSNIAGPLLGGLIVTAGSWRWVFLLPVPLALIAIGVVAVSYSDAKRPAGSALGLNGALAGGITVSLVLLALEPRFAYRLPVAVLAVIGSVVFLVWQSRAAAPILPRRVLFDPVVKSGLLSGFLAGGLLYLSMAYVPLWMTEHAPASPFFTGAPLICLLGGWAVGSTFGVHIYVVRGIRWSAGGGYALAFVSAIFVMLGARAGSLLLVLGGLFALGLGLGPAASTSLVAPQNHVEPHHRGIITSACYASRMLGGSFMIALIGALAAGGSAVKLSFPALIAISGVASVSVLLTAPAREGQEVGSLSNE